LAKNYVVAIYVIWLRELKNYWREKPRVLTPIFQSILLLFIVGIGIGSFMTARGTEVNYVQYIFPGIIVMTIMCSAMNSGISIVWDRESGFMKEILVSPVSRGAIVFGKLLAGTTTAMGQGLVVLCFAPLIGQSLTLLIVLQTFAYMLLLAIMLSIIGILTGFRAASSHSYPLMSNFVIMPMFFLSGALFPLDTVPVWMQILARLNPLSYGVDLIGQGLLKQSTKTTLDLTVLFLVSLMLFALSTSILTRAE
jgi:ABC-2 type transport system permease protein